MVNHFRIPKHRKESDVKEKEYQIVLFLFTSWMIDGPTWLMDSRCEKHMREVANVKREPMCGVPKWNAT